jgi:hypothetical protein
MELLQKNKQLIYDCPVCKGYSDYNYCDNCGGSGKVDWVNNVIPNNNNTLKDISDKIKNHLEWFMFEPDTEEVKYQMYMSFKSYLEDLLHDHEISKYEYQADGKVIIYKFNQYIVLELK